MGDAFARRLPMMDRGSRCIWGTGTLFALAATLFAIATPFGCARRDAPQQEGQTEGVRAATSALNSSPVLSDFVLLADNSLRLKSKVTVEDGDIGARGR